MGDSAISDLQRGLARSHTRAMAGLAASAVSVIGLTVSIAVALRAGARPSQVSGSIPWFGIPLVGAAALSAVLVGHYAHLRRVLQAAADGDVATYLASAGRAVRSVRMAYSVMGAFAGLPGLARILTVARPAGLTDKERTVLDRVPALAVGDQASGERAKAYIGSALRDVQRALRDHARARSGLS